MIHACREGRGWRSCIWVPSLGADSFYQRRTDRKSQGHPERGEFEAADEDGKRTHYDIGGLPTYLFINSAFVCLTLSIYI